jgi:hypothetical protein
VHLQTSSSSSWGAFSTAITGLLGQFVGVKAERRAVRLQASLTSSWAP